MYVADWLSFVRCHLCGERLVNEFIEPDREFYLITYRQSGRAFRSDLGLSFLHALREYIPGLTAMGL